MAIVRASLNVPVSAVVEKTARQPRLPVKAEIVTKHKPVIEEEQLPLELTREQRKLLGLKRGEVIFELTPEEEDLLYPQEGDDEEEFEEEEEQLPLELTREQRKLLGLKRGEVIFELTPEEEDLLYPQEGEEELPLNLTREQRKLLGLKRGEDLYEADLTKEDRAILKASAPDPVASTRVPRGSVEPAASTRTPRGGVPSIEEFKELKRVNRELERDLAKAHRAIAQMVQHADKMKAMLPE